MICGASSAGSSPHAALGEIWAGKEEENLTGASCADSGAHDTNRNVEWPSVLCGTVMGEGHKVFKCRWWWAVGTVMSEGEECHVGVMVKWKVKLWSSIFKRGTSENKTQNFLGHNKHKDCV